MPYHFQYVPPSGPLSGRALEEQTQRAFNELGAEMDAFEKSAAEALDVAANARSTANEALGTANRAISEAQDVNGIAQEAKNESGAALATAQEARNAVNAAVDAASDAAALAETAQATAQEAKSAADAAQAEGQNAAAKAAEAQRLAQAAMTVQSGDFIIDQSSVDADELISRAKIYAATEIINTPATAPAFLEVMSNSGETSVTQAVWSENAPQQYLRTGTTVWGVNAGQSDFALQALPDDSEAAMLEGTLSVSNNGTAMSAVFAPGGFSAAEASDLALYGELRFTLGEGFRGAVLCNDMEISRVAELDLDEDGTTVEAIIVNAEMYSEQTEIALLAAAWETDTLVLHIRAAWQDRSAATTWGGWVAGDTPVATVTAPGAVRPDNATIFVDNAGTISAAPAPEPDAASTTVPGIVQLATTAEAVAGTNAAKAVTPAGLKSALPGAASASAAGLVQLASTAEAVAGTNAVKAVTPAGLKSALPGAATTAAAGLIEIATHAEAQAGTDVTRAVTPGTLKGAFTQSNAANGWMKFPSGMIIQWGLFNTAAAGYSTLTFPVAFTTACHTVVGCDYTGSAPSSGSAICTVGVIAGTKTKTSVTLATTRGDTLVGEGAYWIAIGY